MTDVLRLHPMLPSSRRLVSSFEKEIKVLVSNGTADRPASVQAGANNIAGTLLADGLVTKTEARMLRRIKEELSGEKPSSTEGLAALQAARNLYDALEVNPGERSLGVDAPNITAPKIPIRLVLPGSRALMKALHAAAGRLASPVPPTQEQIQAEARKVIEAVAGRFAPTKEQGRTAGRIADAARPLVDVLKAAATADANAGTQLDSARYFSALEQVASAINVFAAAEHRRMYPGGNDRLPDDRHVPR